MKYNVVTELQHDQVLYVPGSLIDLDSEEVETKLVKDGVIEVFQERPKPVPVSSNARTQTPEEKAAARANKGKKAADESSDDSTNDSPEEKALEDMTASELKEEAEKRGLPTSGTKAELIYRIEGVGEPEEDDNGDDADDL